MGAAHAWNIVWFDDFDAGCTHFREQPIVVAAAQRRMRLSRGPEILLDTNVDLYVSTGKPRTAA